MQRNDLKSSDLIPGEYEGGFKLWEGAMDLCHFLVAQAQHPSPHGIARVGCVFPSACAQYLYRVCLFWRWAADMVCLELSVCSLACVSIFRCLFPSHLAPSI